MLKNENQHLKNLKNKQISLSSFVLLYAWHKMDVYNKVIFMLAGNTDIKNCSMGTIFYIK